MLVFPIMLYGFLIKTVHFVTSRLLLCMTGKYSHPKIGQHRPDIIDAGQSKPILALIAHAKADGFTSVQLD
jgi:hypothetical protein